MSVQQQQTLFDIYNEQGLPIELIILNVLRTIIATIGILFNVSLVYVTAKSKTTLNSPCHLLIAFDCFVSGLYQLSSWVSITVLFNPGHQFIPIRPCCLQILPPFLFGFTSSFTAIYLISLDRLISVIFPFWYNQKENSKKINIILMAISSIFCGLVFVYAAYKIVYSVPDSIKIICVPHECYWSWASDLVYMFFAIFYILTFVNYIIIWIILKYHTWKKNNNNNNLASSSSSSPSWTHRILKTLCIIMIFNFIGLSMNSILRLAVPHLNLNITQKAMAMHSLSCLTIFVMATNAPILYIHNKEYKNAFLNTFKINNNLTSKVTTNNSLKNIKTIQNKNNGGLVPIN